MIASDPGAGVLQTVGNAGVSARKTPRAVNRSFDSAHSSFSIRVRTT
jgi:hypothetical protein